MEEPQVAPALPMPPPPGGWRGAVGLLALFALAGGAGWLFERIGAPLPWMIGPLVVTAIVFIGLSPRLSVPNGLRPIGQVVVATQVGLAFSPEALEMLLSFAPLIVGTALATVLFSFLVAWVMARITGQGLAFWFLATIPTSPVEASTMARDAKMEPVPVILSQTLRLAAVVLIVPMALLALEGFPRGERSPVALTFTDPLHIAVLVGLGVAGMVVFRLLRVPNPNFLGPMAVTAALAASGNGPELYPPVVLAAAQVILGTWLGGTFRRELLTSAIGVTVSSLSATLMLLALCALGALVLSKIAGVDWHMMILASAPGGVVEMALTARFLQQNVVLITAFHLTRIFIIIPNVPWIVRLIARREDRRKP